MAEQTKCVGCGRPREAVRESVSQCDFARNKTVTRCIWLAMQQPATLTEAGAEVTLEQKLQELNQELATARLHTAQLKQRLEAEAAMRIASQEQAAQHKAVADEAHARLSVLQPEIDQVKKALLGGAASPPPSTAPSDVSPSSQTSMLGLIPRIFAWIVATRAKVGSIGAVLGIVLGAGGVGWWQSSPSPAPNIPVTQKPEPLAPKPKPRPQVSAIDMHTRLELRD
jgi:hypothetical protein